MRTPPCGFPKRLLPVPKSKRRSHHNSLSPSCLPQALFPASALTRRVVVDREAVVHRAHVGPLAPRVGALVAADDERQAVRAQERLGRVGAEDAADAAARLVLEEAGLEDGVGPEHVARDERRAEACARARARRADAIEGRRGEGGVERREKG